jgi:hypothetical protein
LPGHKGIGTRMNADERRFWGSIVSFGYSDGNAGWNVSDAVNTMNVPSVTGFWS